jgi:hypothetical protein
MSGEMSTCLDLPFLQPSGHHHSATTIQYLASGELPVVTEEVSQQEAKYYGDSQRQLTLRQAPMHARVAVGKEKGRFFLTPDLIRDAY